MIDEYSDRRDERWKFFDDGSSLSGLDVSRAAGIEVQSDRVRSQQHGIARILVLGDSADLHASHDKPRMAAAGSPETSRCSPIRNASAPAFRSTSTSAL